MAIFWIFTDSILFATPSQKKSPPATKNESLISGTFGEEAIAIHTHIGIINVPTQTITRIHPVQDGKKVLLILRNGDQVSGKPKKPHLLLTRESGNISVAYYNSDGLGIEVFSPAKGVAEVYPMQRVNPEKLLSGLIVDFTFDAGQGQTISNRTKSTPPAKLISGKRVDGTILLDARGDHVTLANHASFEQLNQLSVSIWVKIHSFGPGGYANEHGYLVNKGNDMWWNPAWCLGYSKASGARRGVHPGPLPALFTVGTERAQGRANCRLRSFTKLNAGVWYHLAATYDGRHAVIYVNGRLENRVAYRGKIRRDKAPLLLGGGNLRSTKFGNHFTTDACVDNFRLYNRALSPSEVRALFNIQEAKQPDQPHQG